MPEPTTTSATSMAAAVSGITLALLGVDYYSLLYGMIGALLAVSHSERMARGKAIAFVGLSTVIGAVLGSAAVEMAGATSRTMLIFGCVIGGAGAQGFVAALIRLGTAKIDQWGTK